MSEPLAVRFHNATRVLNMEEVVDLYSSYFVREFIPPDGQIVMILFSDESLYINSSIPKYESVFVFENPLALIESKFSAHQQRLWTHISNHIENTLKTQNAN